MKIHSLVQNTPEWHEFRRHHHGASEASAMLGLSPYKTRAELLREKATGIVPEVDEATQQIFDHGHEVEALARPLIEKIIGEDLYPVTCTNDEVCPGLSASCDGLTMMGDTAFEHKQWNKVLAESVRNGVLPEEHQPQCQQLLLVTGADLLIFAVSDGTEENLTWMEVRPDAEYQQRIVAGWKQFDEDLVNYSPEPVEAPVVAQAREALPAVYATVSGSLSVRSNLEAFGLALKAFVERIPKAPETDQEFADTEAACKTLKQAEERLEAAEDQALASLSDVEVMRRTVADLKGVARQTRLVSEKLVKARKEAIRTEIVTMARQQFQAFISSLQGEITGVRLVVDMPDFGAAIKGLKTLSSIRNAVNTTLANAKVEANQYAADVRTKLAWYSENVPAEYRGLFRDLDDLVTMAPQHFEAAVSGRVEQHKAQEAARLEAELERIRAEEQARAERAAQVQPEEPRAVEHKPILSVPPNVRHLAPLEEEPATLSLGSINERLDPIRLSCAGLEQLGITPSATHKAAKLYRESDFGRICSALIERIQAIQMAEVA